MNAPGKTLLKVVSILFIVFGAIATVVSLLAMIGTAALSALDSAGAARVVGILVVAILIALVGGVLDLVLGIIGLKKCGDPSKAGYFITVGIILCVLSLISMIVSAASGNFQITSLIGFVLPILYIVGGTQNKKAAVAEPVQQQFEQQQ
jgi:hypothetical protein